MPKFLTLTATHIAGQQPYACAKFQESGYVAVGWMEDTDLGTLTDSQRESIVRSRNYPNEASALDSLTKFLALEVGDYVAIKNVGHGLFAIGRVSGPYEFRKLFHDVGDPDRSQWYSHILPVEWKNCEYRTRKQLVADGEKAWAPYGTTGKLSDELPPYAQRYLNDELIVAGQSSTQNASAEAAPLKFVRPDWIEPVIQEIEALRKDPKHLERAHESLVEDLLVALGWQKHRDIVFQQGRVDIMVRDEGQPRIAIEVKRDWRLDSESQEVIMQVYRYALRFGVRFAVITNGDNYAVFDRLRGLSLEENLVVDCSLSALQEGESELLRMYLKPGVPPSADADLD